MKIIRNSNTVDVASKPIPVMSLAVIQIRSNGDAELADALERLCADWAEEINAHQKRKASAQSSLELGR